MRPSERWGGRQQSAWLCSFRRNIGHDPPLQLDLSFVALGSVVADLAASRQTGSAGSDGSGGANPPLANGGIQIGGGFKMSLSAGARSIGERLLYRKCLESVTGLSPTLVEG